MLGAKHKHIWDWLGETRESTYEWCQFCGAVRRTRDTGTRVFLPFRVKAKMSKEKRRDVRSKT